MADVTNGCTRLAGALTELARTHGFGDKFRAVATPFYWGEAAVFEVFPDDWPPLLHAFLVDTLDYVDETLVNIRVLEKHGNLYFAAVPLTEEAADDLAEALEKHARWRSEGQP